MWPYVFIRVWSTAIEDGVGGLVSTGVTRSYETTPSHDLTVGLCLGPMVALGRGWVSYERGTPVERGLHAATPRREGRSSRPRTIRTLSVFGWTVQPTAGELNTAQAWGLLSVGGMPQNPILPYNTLPCPTLPYRTLLCPNSQYCTLSHPPSRAGGMHYWIGPAQGEVWFGVGV